MCKLEYSKKTIDAIGTDTSYFQVGGFLTKNESPSSYSPKIVTKQFATPDLPKFANF